MFDLYLKEKSKQSICLIVFSCQQYYHSRKICAQCLLDGVTRYFNLQHHVDLAARISPFYLVAIVPEVKQLQLCQSFCACLWLLVRDALAVWSEPRLWLGCWTSANSKQIPLWFCCARQWKYYFSWRKC